MSAPASICIRQIIDALREKKSNLCEDKAGIVKSPRYEIGVREKAATCDVMP